MQMIDPDFHDCISPEDQAPVQGLNPMAFLYQVCFQWHVLSKVVSRLHHAIQKAENLQLYFSELTKLIHL